MTFYSNPKVKTYGVLNPRGKALYEDTDRFGTKMLEKMGWSKGKGLGANLDGSLNFIKVAHKDNQKGMGFKDRDDQWTQHEDNFNALLKSFETNNDDKKSESDDADESAGHVGFGFKSEKPKPTKESLFSGVSLEEQSKKSRSRVHYKKFTRGKDMARYSEQDLANIFGKKSLGDKHATAEEPEPVAEEVSEDKSDEDKSFGVTVIKTGLSVSDYFKAKMDAIRKNRKGPEGEGSSNPFYVYNPDKIELKFNDKDEEESPELPEAVECETKPEKKSKKKRQHTDQTETEPQAVEEPVKKKKKSKKSKRSDDEAPLANEENVEPTVAVTETTEDKGTKKRKKKSIEVEPDETTGNSDKVLNEQDTLNADEVTTKKHKKSKKNKRQDEDIPLLDEAEESVGVEPPKKKKKMKSREVIPTQPMHFPKFISNVLTSLYDPHVPDIRSAELGVQPTPLPQPQDATNSTTLKDTFELGKFHAEVFRFFDINAFAGSSLGDLAGYGYSQNLTLQVKTGSNDENRITHFWDVALTNKYGADTIKAQKKKKKQKYSIKVLTKKNLFKI